MRKWIVALLLVALLIPAVAHGQGKARFSALVIDLWPEFDRPGVLVIYRLTLSPQTSLPASLTFRIPAAVGMPNAVAVGQTDSTVGDVAYDRQVSGDWAEVSFTATMPAVRVEYYDPGLTIQDQARHFDYRWPGDYAVDSVVAVIQQPWGASNLRISPGTAQGAAGEDGLMYYSLDVGPLEEGQSFAIALDYQKSSDALTVENARVEPSAPLPASAPGQISFTQVLPWLLGGVGAILVFGGLGWYFMAGRQPAQHKSPRRRRSPAREVEEGAGESVYCHQCGKRAAPGDRFCRACGAQLRVE